jgi:hypothetical protein
LPSTLHEAPSLWYKHDDYVIELKGRLQIARGIAKQKLIAAKQYSKYFEKKKNSKRV